MINISEWILDIFGPYGYTGIMIFVFLIFFIDAVVFPTLPELFFIVAFMFDPSLEWGIAILTVAVIAEVVGISLIYIIVKKIRIPGKIKKIADKYVSFLVIGDEKILLVNRVAPMIPFAGAFIYLIDSWRYKRAMVFIVLGCFIKYGTIMLMSNFFYAFFDGPDAQRYTIIFIFAVIIASFIAAFFKKKKSGLAE